MSLREMKLCQKQNSIEGGGLGRVCFRESCQEVIQNPTSSNGVSQRAKSRNRKKFRKWKKRSLMKKNQNLLTPQKKAMSHLHCGEHCLGWMGLNRALAEANCNKSICCCSTQFHLNHYLQLLFDKGGSSQSLKSVVR